MLKRSCLVVLAVAGMGLVKAMPIWSEESAPALQIVPSTFDFGWCPDNAKVSAKFAVKNTGTELIALLAVQPTCGCTATDFTPADLSSAQETEIGLTFNTRGYTGQKFNKSAKVSAGKPEKEYTVNLTGHVMNPNAMIAPIGDGVASFEPGMKDSEKKIEIKNMSEKDMELKIVQPAAGWSEVALKEDKISAGHTGTVVVSVTGSLEEPKDTSATFEAMSGTETYRFTVAVRTGPGPTAYRKIRTVEPKKVKPEAITIPKPSPKK